MTSHNSQNRLQQLQELVLQCAQEIIDEDGTPNASRDNDPNVAMQNAIERAIEEQRPFYLEDLYRELDADKAALTTLQKLLARCPKPAAGDVITLKMGITVKVIPTLDNSLVGRVIEDASGLYRPNTKIEFELSEVA